MADLTARVRWIHVDDGLVIFAPLSKAFVDLDKSGTELFELMLETAWDVEATAQRLGTRHELAVDEALDIVKDFTASLQRYGVLSRGT